MPDSLPLHVGQIDHTPMVHHCHFENKFKFANFEIGSYQVRVAVPGKGFLLVYTTRQAPSSGVCMFRARGAIHGVEKTTRGIK